MNVSLIGEEDRATLKKIKKLSREYGVIIGFGWVGKQKDIYKNHYTIVDNRGEIVADYEKIHPFMTEKEVITPGNKLVIFNLCGTAASTFVCFDLRFPELFRQVIPKVHLAIVPGNWPRIRREQWKTLLVARAIENQIYILGINCFGNINNLEYSGDSCVINPDGIINNILSDKPGILVCEIQDNVDKYRERFPVVRDYNVEELKGIRVERY